MTATPDPRHPSQYRHPEELEPEPAEPGTLELLVILAVVIVAGGVALAVLAGLMLALVVSA